MDVVANVLRRGQSAIFFLGQQLRDGGIENRAFGIDIANFVFERLLAALLGRLVDPDLEPFDERILWVFLVKFGRFCLSFLPAILLRQVEYFLHLAIVRGTELYFWPFG